MKRIHFILIFISIVSLIENVFSQNTEKDTLFLLKDLKEGSKQSIFIDKNPKSNYFEELSNFNFSISQNKMKSVPIIVNRCDYHKQHEYFFEEPDYEMLGRKFK